MISIFSNKDFGSSCKQHSQTRDEEIIPIFSLEYDFISKRENFSTGLLTNSGVNNSLGEKRRQQNSSSIFHDPSEAQSSMFLKAQLGLLRLGLPLRLKLIFKTRTRQLRFLRQSCAVYTRIYHRRAVYEVSLEDGTLKLSIEVLEKILAAAVERVSDGYYTEGATRSFREEKKGYGRRVERKLKTHFRPTGRASISLERELVSAAADDSSRERLVFPFSRCFL